MDRNKKTVVYGPEPVAKHFGVTVRTVQLWVKKGMPKSGKYYDLVQCELWRQKQQEQEASTSGDGDGEEAGESKSYWSKREIKARAELKEMELRQRQGELIEAKNVEKFFVARIIAVKQGLLTLSRSLPPLLYGKNEREMEAIISKKVRELLEGFARQQTIMPPRPIDRKKLMEFVDDLLKEWETATEKLKRIL